MKKSFYIIFLFGLIFGSLLKVCAQEKIVSEQEVETLKKNAHERLKNKTYRVTMTSEGYENINDPIKTRFIKEITEYLPPDHYYRFYERKGKQSITREETISVGQTKYYRQNNEDWKKLLPVTNSAGNGPGGVPINNEKTIEYKYLGKETVKNQNADLYIVKTTRKYNEPNYKSTTVITEKFWFDKGGFFIKRESETKRNNEKVASHIIWEYEYDLDIKIEAPIIKSETKTKP